MLSNERYQFEQVGSEADDTCVFNRKFFIKQGQSAYKNSIRNED